MTKTKDTPQTPKEQLRELEDRKKELELQIKQEKTTKWQKELEDRLLGKCFIDCSKKAGMRSICAWYYKEVEYKADGGDYPYSVKYESVDVLYDKHYGYRVGTMLKDSRTCRSISDFDIRNPITLEQFNMMKGLTKAVSERFATDFQDGGLTIKYTTTNGEYYNNKTLHESYDKYCDLPNILLSQDEIWNVSRGCTPCFLVGDIFYCTKGAVKFLKDLIGEQRKDDSFSIQACASVGERYRGAGRRVAELEAILVRVQKVLKREGTNK